MNALNWTQVLQFINITTKNIKKCKQGGDGKRRKGSISHFMDKTWKKMFSTKKLWKSDVAISQKTNFRGKKKSRKSRDFCCDN